MRQIFDEPIIVLSLIFYNLIIIFLGFFDFSILQLSLIEIITLLQKQKQKQKKNKTKCEIVFKRKTLPKWGKLVREILWQWRRVFKC